MEVYLSYGLLVILGVIFTILIRSLVRMYERLWTDNGKKTGNPEEMFGIFMEAMNEANKRQEDRLRKRTSRSSVADTTEDTEVVPSLESPGTIEDKITALWDQYKELGGE